MWQDVLNSTAHTSLCSPSSVWLSFNSCLHPIQGRNSTTYINIEYRTTGLFNFRPGNGHFNNSSRSIFDVRQATYGEYFPIYGMWRGEGFRLAFTISLDKSPPSKPSYHLILHISHSLLPNIISKERPIIFIPLLVRMVASQVPQKFKHRHLGGFSLLSFQNRWST